MTDLTPENLDEDTLPEHSLYAAVDLGSNSFHMIIARDVHGQMQVIDKHKEMVRLRAGMDEHGKLTKEAWDTAIACLERFAQLIKHIPHQQIRAVGTNTLRNAKNSRAFLRDARKALGHEIEIIPGQEEARLIYLGVANGLPPSKDQRLVMDIGGGSTEYIIGENTSCNHLTSTEMGCVSISQMYFPDNKVNAHSLQRAVFRCRRILQPHRKQLIELSWDTAIGASGSIKAIAQILDENAWSKKGITLEGLRELASAFIQTGSVEGAKIEGLKGLKDERIPVILGGLAILIATFETLPIKLMSVSPNALREGLILDTLGRVHTEDAREISIKSMQKWAKTDLAQSQKIVETALDLYKQTHNTWSLKNKHYPYKKLLRWAAMTHEIGMFISYRKHRQHSAYLIKNAELPGFSQQEKQMLSAMLINQRGKFSTLEFEDFNKSNRTKLPYLTILLRIAVLVHRGREADTIMPQINVNKNNDIHLEFSENWLTEHPLTKLDLKTESENIAAIGCQLTFE